jgi:hypothetical protein
VCRGTTIYFSILLHCIVQWVLQVIFSSACSFIVLVSLTACFGLHGHLQVCRIFYFRMLEGFCFAAFFCLFFSRGHTLHVSVCVFFSVFLRYFCCFLARVFVCLPFLSCLSILLPVLVARRDCEKTRNYLLG